MKENPQETRGKVALTRERLANLAREYGPGAKMPTVPHLCDLLDTTPPALTQALARLEAEGVLRRRQGGGGGEDDLFVSEALNRRRRIALICDPSFFGMAGLSPFWGMLVERIQQGRRTGGDARGGGGEEISLHFTLPGGGGGGADAPTRDRSRLPLHEDLATAVCEGRIHGALGIGLPESVAHWLEMSDVPLVSFAGAGGASVGVDYPAMIELLVGALVRQGCRRLQMWSPVYGHRPTPADQTARYLGNRNAFARALAAAGLPFDLSQYRCPGHTGRGRGAVGSSACCDAVAAADAAHHAVSPGEQGYETALSVFGPGTPPQARPDGVVILDDMMTLGALGALQALNLRPGRDLRIATHANAGSPALMGWESLLTVAEVDPGRVVNEMFRLLDAYLDREPVDNPRVLVPPALHLPAATT